MPSSVKQRANQVLPRGVHVADYLVDGSNVLLVIDRRGNCVKRMKYRDEAEEHVRRTWLEGFLEHVDPDPPRLTLILPTPPAAMQRLRMSPAVFHRMIMRA